jgi:hypothetical protein
MGVFWYIASQNRNSSNNIYLPGVINLQPMRSKSKEQRARQQQQQQQQRRTKYAIFTSIQCDSYF